MLYFSEREKLANLYKKWQKENNILDCAASVIGFLVSNKLVNCDLARELIHKENGTCVKLSDDKITTITEEE